MLPQTKQGYRKTLKSMYPRLNGAKRFVDLDVKGFERMTEGISESYANNALCGIKWILRDRYGLNDHPLLDHTVRRTRKKAPKYFTETEVMTALEKMDARRTIAKRNRAIIGVSVAAGLRSHELVGLDVDDVLWEIGRIYVKSRKGGDATTSRLSPQVLEWVKKWIDARLDKGTDALFTAVYHGTRLTTDGYRSICSKQFAKLFEKHVHPHMFRHTMVKIMRDKGVSDDYICSQGGWSDRDTFKDFYDCLDLDQLDANDLPFGGA